MWGLVVLVVVGIVTPPSMRTSTSRGGQASFLQLQADQDGLGGDSLLSDQDLGNLSEEDGMKLVEKLSGIESSLMSTEKEFNQNFNTGHQSLVNSMHELSAPFQSDLSGYHRPSGVTPSSQMLAQAQAKQIAPGTTSWITDPNEMFEAMANPWLDPRFRDAYDQWREAINFAYVLNRPDYEYKSLFVPGVGMIRPWIVYPRPYLDDAAAGTISAKWGGSMGLPGMLMGGLSDQAKGAGDKTEEAGDKSEGDKEEGEEGKDEGDEKEDADKEQEQEAGNEAAKEDDTQEAQQDKSENPEGTEMADASEATNAAQDAATDPEGKGKEMAKMMAQSMIDKVMAKVPPELREFVLNTGEVSKSQFDMTNKMAEAEDEGEEEEEEQPTDKPK